ncbi:MAG: TRAP transporter substrate-binding protein [Peptostreptococcaceae bacterium]|nr:TRAP transporter substrate-binding protein [Peptostreptococcaceae bacterium]
MKKLLVFVLMLFVVLGLVVAQGGSEETKKSGKTYEINFGIHTSTGSNEVYALDRFKSLLEERSEGRFSVKLFPNAALGSELENLEQVKTGEIQMAIFGDNLTGQLAAKYDPTIIPFLYESLQDTYSVLESDVGKMINKSVEERGNQKIVAYESRGARNLTTSRNVTKPADIAGLKLRIPEITSWVTVWKALGANPTPIALAEVYSALQTGIVDGQENPLDLINTNKFWEVNNNIVLTEHIWGVFKWTVNIDFFNNLPADLQVMLTDTAKECAAWGDERIAKHELDIRKTLEAEGVKFVVVDKAAFMKAALPGIKAVAETMDPVVKALVMQKISSL